MKTMRMSFGTNLAETQSWLRLRNSGWETAEGWWAESRLNEVDWWFFYCHLFVLRAGQPRERERDCSQRTQELIFLMCKVDYTICSAFNGFNTTVLLSNWWQKLNLYIYFFKMLIWCFPHLQQGAEVNTYHLLYASCISKWLIDPSIDWVGSYTQIIFRD